MSSTMSPASAPAPASAPVPASGPTRRRRWRTPVVLAAGLLAALIVAIWLGRPSTPHPGRLDPENPGPDGAQALARVLADQGVDVEIVRSADAFDDTRTDANTTVVVTSSDQLGASTVDRLRAHAGAATIVLLDPAFPVLDAFGIDAFPDPTDDGDPIDADCPTFPDLRLQGDTVLRYPHDDATGCFGADAQAFVVADEVVLFGGGESLDNDQVLRADNAAIGLRLLGHRDRLVWYVPDANDLSADDALSVSSLLPDWLRPGLALGAVCLVALMLWRGRRLGRLATEPLPVTVRAIETTRSRGRLYRRAGDRGHAAGTLRAAARSRCARRLRLGPGVSEATLLGAVATASGRALPEVQFLLASTAPVPGNDRDLLHLAASVADLEEEVRRS